MHTELAKNDWIEADVEFHTLESACEILLSYGADVQAIEPAELIERIISQAQTILEMYNGLGISACPNV